MRGAEKIEPDISYLTPTDQVPPLGSATNGVPLSEGLLSEGQSNPGDSSCPQWAALLVCSFSYIPWGVPPQLTPKSS